MLLDTTTQSLEILLAAAVASTQLPVVVVFTDGTTSPGPSSTQHSITNSTTAVTILTAPASTFKREVTFLSVFNADTDAVTVTIRLNDNSTMRIIRKVTLEVGDHLDYTNERNFEVMDKHGKKKVSDTIASSFLALDGEQGDQGDPGLRGEAGATGPQGLMGPPGLDAEDGIDGFPGIIGLTGSMG